MSIFLPGEFEGTPQSKDQAPQTAPKADMERVLDSSLQYLGQALGMMGMMMSDEEVKKIKNTVVDPDFPNVKQNSFTGKLAIHVDRETNPEGTVAAVVEAKKFIEKYGRGEVTVRAKPAETRGKPSETYEDGMRRLQIEARHPGVVTLTSREPSADDRNTFNVNKVTARDLAEPLKLTDKEVEKLKVDMPDKPTVAVKVEPTQPTIYQTVVNALSGAVSGFGIASGPSESQRLVATGKDGTVGANRVNTVEAIRGNSKA